MQCIFDIFKKWATRRISSSVFFVFPSDRFLFHIRSFCNNDIFFVFFGYFPKIFREDWRKSSMSTSFYKVSSRMLLVLYFFSNKRFISLIPCESFFLKIYRSNLRKSLRLLFFFDFFVNLSTLVWHWFMSIFMPFQLIFC